MKRIAALIKEHPLFAIAMSIALVVSFGVVYRIVSAGFANGNVIAEIGAGKITDQMVDRQIRLSGTRVPPAAMAVFVPQLIHAMIVDRALAYEAERRGFKVSDAEVRRLIASTPQLANLPPDEEKRVLQQMGYTVDEFERESRNSVLAKMLLDNLANGIKVTDEETEKTYREASLKIGLQYIDFPPSREQDAKEAAEVLAKNRGNIGALAKRFGVKLWTADLTRRGSVGGMKDADLDDTLFKEAFSKPVGAIVGPIVVDRWWVVAKVVERVDADMKGFAAQRDAIAMNLKARKVQERIESFKESLLDQLSREGKFKLHKDAVDRIVSRYREHV